MIITLIIKHACFLSLFIFKRALNHDDDMRVFFNDDANLD
jgi:hypothetical protein